jgi:hypothetical protein
MVAIRRKEKKNRKTCHNINNSLTLTWMKPKLRKKYINNNTIVQHVKKKRKDEEF